jgi:hypothetical protein
MLDIYLEPEPQVFCPECGEIADFFRGRIICNECYEEEACNDA